MFLSQIFLSEVYFLSESSIVYLTLDRGKMKVRQYVLVIIIHILLFNSNNITVVVVIES